MKVGYRLGYPVEKVYHANLERLNEDSAYKSWCSVCDAGVLLVKRTPSFKLSRNDHCTTCGQKFFYQDETINGEHFDKEDNT